MHGRELQLLAIQIIRLVSTSTFVFVSTYLFIQVNAVHILINCLSLSRMTLRTVFVIQSGILSRLRLILT
mgnify:FL=1